MIIVTSDNGGLSQYDDPNTPATYNEPLLGGKGHLYEGGIRVPLIVYWPGVTKPGSSSDVPVHSNDFCPTMLEVAGLKLDPQNQIDGQSLAPLLRKSGSLKREALYWHYPFYDLDGAKPGGAIRHGDYKLIEFYDDGHLELFNLKEDIGETTNLVGRRPDKAKAMHRMLDSWRKSLGVTAGVQGP
jgi:arylsulfatase A-like enzyme